MVERHCNSKLTFKCIAFQIYYVVCGYVKNLKVFVDNTPKERGVRKLLKVVPVESQLQNVPRVKRRMSA